PHQKIRHGLSLRAAYWACCAVSPTATREGRRPVICRFPVGTSHLGRRGAKLCLTDEAPLRLLRSPGKGPSASAARRALSVSAGITRPQWREGRPGRDGPHLVYRSVLGGRLVLTLAQRPAFLSP